MIGLALGGSDGGASILDLHSGALSYKDKFINIYSVETKKKFITATDISIYKIARSKIQHAIAEQFNIDENSLYLTHPTFFSRLTNVEPKTPHDEYWHTHIDKVNKFKNCIFPLKFIMFTFRLLMNHSITHH